MVYPGLRRNVKFLDCADHGDQLIPNGGPANSCGLCGRMLFQETLLNECACGVLFGTIQTRKWIGDAWVVDPDDALDVLPAARTHATSCELIRDEMARRYPPVLPSPEGPDTPHEEGGEQ